MSNNLQPLKDHALIGQAVKIPINQPESFISISPIVVPAPGRIVELQIRVSAPRTGNDLPIILLSHGQGQSNHLSSLNGYGPLVDFWAAHGFVVIQPTHLSSKSLSLGATSDEGPMYWKSRVEDMKRILDRLDDIETAVPEIKGRLDRSRVAVAGHSMGGHTASLLLGARITSLADGTVTNWGDPRIKAGVLLGAPGSPGKDGSYLSAWVLENFQFFKEISFSDMTTPTLVVVGDKDASPHLTNRGVEWHSDPYFLSSGPKTLLTAPDTYSAVFLGLTPMKPTTKTPSGWLLSRGLRGPTFAVSFIQGKRLGLLYLGLLETSLHLARLNPNEKRSEEHFPMMYA